MTYLFDALIDSVLEFPRLFVGAAGAFAVLLVVAAVFA